jgi:hypothetical protein
MNQLEWKTIEKDGYPKDGTNVIVAVCNLLYTNEYTYIAFEVCIKENGKPHFINMGFTEESNIKYWAYIPSAPMITK